MHNEIKLATRNCHNLLPVAIFKSNIMQRHGEADALVLRESQDDSVDREDPSQTRGTGCRREHSRICMPQCRRAGPFENSSSGSDAMHTYTHAMHGHIVMMTLVIHQTGSNSSITMLIALTCPRCRWPSITSNLCLLYQTIHKSHRTYPSVYETS
jgi:hypothetical protein